jgi:hypothetical protein
VKKEGKEGEKREFGGHFSNSKTVECGFGGVKSVEFFVGVQKEGN